jgi:tetratricopeptide (TPR) repeat protein
MFPQQVSPMRFCFGTAVLCALFCGSAIAQKPAQSTSSSSSNSAAPAIQEQSKVHPGTGGKDDPTVGSITLESNESLFDVAVALNACGYDSDLAESSPIRTEVRADVAAAVAASAPAKAAQAAVCNYISEHQLADKGRDVAQYVSLGLYLGPPPALNPIADETEMPPDALGVVNILPLLRTFADAVGLHAIWLKHHPEYEAITDRLHKPVTDLVFGTNIYLKIPISSYEDRRLLILIEPMLAPNEPNARIYASDYIVVTSPNAAGAVRMDQIRHTYLHYTIEPLVYAKAASMVRLQPLLKPVADAPLEFVYKTDVVALVTECLIKAIEARRMDTGLSPPPKPTGPKDRQADALYSDRLAAYERDAEQARRKQVDLDMRQGWVLTEYFYGQLVQLEHEPEGLNEYIGQMVYGMDVGREQHHDEQIAFLPVGSSEYVRRAPRALTGLMLAEKDMYEGKLDDADEIADKALTDPKLDHAQALYLKARIVLMQGDPETSMTDLQEVVKTAKDPHTEAWAHVYLGRLYDTKEPTERAAAVTQYKAALSVAGVPPDAQAAANKGLSTPFTVPKVTHEEEEPLDPSGKAEKQNYKPE